MKPYRPPMRHLPALLLLLAVSACGSSEQAPAAAEPSTPEVFDVRGKLELVDTFTADGDGDPCEGRDGYDDLRPGAEVVVRDSSGETIGFGEIGSSVADQAALTCTFNFSVLDVPVAERDIYSFEVAGRGELRFKQADAGDLGATIGP